MRTFVKNLLCSRPVYLTVEWLASAIFQMRHALPHSLVARSFLAVVRIQLEIGFKVGVYACRGQNDGHAQHRLERLQGRVIDIAAGLRIDGHGTGHGGQEPSPRVLLVATAIVNVGGHTRLLDSFLRHIASASLYLRTKVEDAGRKVSDAPGPVDSILANGTRTILRDQPFYFSVIDQIREIYRDFQTIAPQCIVLVNNPTDLGLFVATRLYARSCDRCKVIFFHHADDYFPFFGNVFDRHVDMDANSIDACDGIPGRRFVRISTKSRFDERSVSDNSCSAPRRFTIFSFASFGKISGATAYPELLAALTRAGIQVVLATKAGSAAALHGCLQTAGCDMKSIEIDEHCLDIAKYRGRIHAYLDTFPVGGGMSVLDSLSMGLPSAMHAGAGHQIFRDAVLEPFMFPDSGAILDYFVRLMRDAEFHRAQCDVALRLFKDHYTEEAMAAALMRVVTELVPS